MMVLSSLLQGLGSFSTLLRLLRLLETALLPWPQGTAGDASSWHNRQAPQGLRAKTAACLASVYLVPALLTSSQVTLLFPPHVQH